MNSSHNEYEIRPAATPAEYRACQSAQRLAWGIVEPGYLVPIATMVSVQLHGGLVLGAFTPQGESLGLSFAFLGRIEGELCLYSQLTGVIPGNQSRGIGLKLKTAQREFARSQGLKCVAWAFDPLQAGNARFNLNKLGATSSRYIEDMYGPRTDALNAAAGPTDRLIAVWPTDPAESRAYLLDPNDIDTIPRLIRPDARFDEDRDLDSVVDLSAIGRSPRVALDIPDSIATLRRDDGAQALRRVIATRGAFLAAFAAGYQAVACLDLTDSEGSRRASYLLIKES